MKIKGLAVLGLAAVAGLAGCRGGANTNTAVVNTSTTTSNVNMTMATPMQMSTPTAAPDTATQTAVESALKKAGIDGVNVAATSSVVTLRGTVAKGKLAEAYRVASETSRRKVDNQLTEK